MRTCFIIRGLPGSGKSTIADYLAAHSTAIHISTDDYFMNSRGEYVFDASKIGDAHEDTYKRFMDLVLLCECDVAVANTFTQEWEFERYLQFATQHGLQTHVITVENYHNGKSEHNVPEHVIRKMGLRFTTKLR